MRLLLLGGSGQVGTAIQRIISPEWQLDAPGSLLVSLADPKAVADYIAETEPEAVINTAAFTNVDDAEVEKDIALLINATAPAAIARATVQIGARLLHVSTDYVFDGFGELPYMANAPTHPLNVYGESKRDGEHLVLNANPDAAVVRTSWVHAGGGVNFVATAVRLLSSGKSMKVVDDQVGRPTRAENLAVALLRLAENQSASGLLHFTDAGVASWYDVASCVLETLRELGRVSDDVTVSPVDSSAYPRPAKRPRVSILDCHESWNAIGWTPPHWREGVKASTRELLSA